MLVRDFRPVGTSHMRVDGVEGEGDWSVVFWRFDRGFIHE